MNDSYEVVNLENCCSLSDLTNTIVTYNFKKVIDKKVNSSQNDVEELKHMVYSCGNQVVFCELNNPVVSDMINRKVNSCKNRVSFE